MYNFHNFSLTPEQDLVVNITIFAVLIYSIIKGERKLSDTSPLVTLLLITFFAFLGGFCSNPFQMFSPSQSL